ncbi:hypothetical protein H6P81_015821 [Aristolochia fimbriata]|uniref:Uncharacterized protein n=1 Tax=Aristolochia fimbriata TaxID=158543 RepID=A0AAV7E9M9_ARIFI|nr:hypothetical protein H6P81_015821 [Aristolochia fimbriata]
MFVGSAAESSVLPQEESLLPENQIVIVPTDNDCPQFVSSPLHDISDSSLASSIALLALGVTSSLDTLANAAEDVPIEPNVLDDVDGNGSNTNYFVRTDEILLSSLKRKKSYRPCKPTPSTKKPRRLLRNQSPLRGKLLLLQMVLQVDFIHKYQNRFFDL